MKAELLGSTPAHGWFCNADPVDSFATSLRAAQQLCKFGLGKLGAGRRKKSSELMKFGIVLQ